MYLIVIIIIMYMRMKGHGIFYDTLKGVSAHINSKFLLVSRLFLLPHFAEPQQLCSMTALLVYEQSTGHIGFKLWNLWPIGGLYLHKILSLLERNRHRCFLSHPREPSYQE